MKVGLPALSASTRCSVKPHHGLILRLAEAAKTKIAAMLVLGEAFFLTSIEPVQGSLSHCCTLRVHHQTSFPKINAFLSPRSRDFQKFIGDMQVFICAVGAWICVRRRRRTWAQKRRPQGDPKAKGVSPDEEITKKVEQNMTKESLTKEPRIGDAAELGNG
jgi:hypothetical protein